MITITHYAGKWRTYRSRRKGIMRRVSDWVDLA